MKVSEAIAKRKSIRSYTDQAVSEEDLAQIVEAGRWAPNAGPYAISVIRDADLLKRIDEATSQAMLASGDDFMVGRASLPGYRPLYGAPVLIILSGPTDAPLTMLNVATAVENILLQATELGLGSCFLFSATAVLNADEYQDMAREAGIPEGYRMECGALIGYTDDEDRFRMGEREIRGTVTYVG